MSTLTADEIAAKLSPLIHRSGLTPFVIEVSSAEDDPSDMTAHADVTVDMAGSLTPEEAVMKAKALARDIDGTFGGACRFGYYDREIGYDDVPEGKCLIQIDLLPWSLSPASPAPGR